MTQKVKDGLLIMLTLSVAAWALFAFAGKSTPSYVPLQMYNRDGLIPVTKRKMFVDTFAITTNTKTIDISAVEFDSVHSVSVTPIKNGSSNNTLPWINVENWDNDAVNLKIYRPNNTLQNVLGFNLLLGAAILDYTSPSGVYISITVCGE